MTAATLPFRPPALVPVPHGLAEQLARIAHFRALDLPEVDELDQVATFLIGDVGDRDARADLWAGLTDDCLKLWHLISDDWSEDDLDDVPEADWQRYDFATGQQELDHRQETTRNRLVDEIEHAIRRARYCAVEDRRAAARRAHRAAVDSAVHRHPAGARITPDGAA